MGFSLAGIKPKTRLPFVGGLLGVLYFPGLLGCGESPAKPPEEAASKVLFHGCQVLQQTAHGLVCTLMADSPTVLWIAGYSCDALEFLEDGKIVSISAKWVKGGCQIRSISPATKIASSYTARIRDNHRVLWHVDVDRSMLSPLQLTRQILTRSLSDVDSPIAYAISALTNDPPLSIIDRALASAIALSRLGRLDTALSSLAEVQELAEQAGYPSVSLEAAFRRIMTLRISGLLSEAERIRFVAQEKARAFPWDSKIQIRVNWHAGMNLRAMGMTTDAIKYVQQVVDDAWRVDDIPGLQVYMPVLADLFLALGRTSEMHSVIDEIPMQSTDECTRAGLLTNLGELYMQEMQASPSLTTSDLDVPAEKFLQSALAARATCSDRSTEADIYIGLAQVAIIKKRFADAASFVQKANHYSNHRSFQRAQLLELEAQIALNFDKVDVAEQLIDRLDTLYAQKQLDWYELVRCKVAFGRFHIQRKRKQSMPNVTQSVNTCTGPESKISIIDQKILLQRLKVLDGE